MPAERLMLPGVGRAAGGIVGYLMPTGQVSGSSAQVSVYAYNSAGGLVGRASQGGLVERSWAAADVSAVESAGGLVGQFEFKSTFRDVYGTGTVTAESGSGEPFSGNPNDDYYFAHALFAGQASGSGDPQHENDSVLYGATTAARQVSAAELASAATFTGFDPTIWALDPATLAASGRPRLAWELAPPTPVGPPQVPLTFSIYSVYPPVGVWVHHKQSARYSFGSFVAPNGSSQYATATVLVEPGAVEFTLIDRISEACSWNSGGAPDPVPTPATVTAPLTQITRWAQCTNTQSLAPSTGPYLRAPRPGELGPGTLLATVNGHEYRLTDGEVTRDTTVINPKGWWLVDRAAYRDGNYLYFVINRAQIPPGNGNPPSYPNDPVAQLGTPILDLGAGSWLRDQGNFVNIAGLQALAYANGTLTGYWISRSDQEFDVSVRLSDFLRNSTNVP
jgi:hypothetical protein